MKIFIKIHDAILACVIESLSKNHVGEVPAL